MSTHQPSFGMTAEPASSVTTLRLGTQIAAEFNSMFSLGSSEILTGNFTNATQSHVTLITGNRRLEFYGSNFTYSTSGIPNGGVLSKIEDFEYGVLWYSLSAISFSVSEFFESALNNASFSAFAKMFSGDDQILGSPLADLVTGRSGNDAIFGFAGDDSMIGESGDDVLDGGEGADAMQGNAGNDTFVIDNAGDSLFENPGQGMDTIISYIDYVLPPVSFSHEIENLHLLGLAANGTGNLLANTITGNDIANTLSGMEGADFINALSGADTVRGGSGADVLLGGAGDDTIDGGSENDAILAQAGDDNVSGGADNDAIVGGTGADTIDGGAGNDIIDGSEDNDTILGQEGDDTLVGASGHDAIAGGDGIDFLHGYGHADILFGGNGADLIIGGAGADILRGDGGGDLYGFNLGDQGDLIQNFNEGGVRDGIDLRPLFDATGYVGTNPRGDGILGVLQNGADTDVYAYGVFFFRIQGVTAAAIDDSYFLFQ